MTIATFHRFFLLRFFWRIATGQSIITNISPRLSPARIPAGLFAHLTSVQLLFVIIFHSPYATYPRWRPLRLRRVQPSTLNLLTVMSRLQHPDTHSALQVCERTCALKIASVSTKNANWDAASVSLSAPQRSALSTWSRLQLACQRSIKLSWNIFSYLKDLFCYCYYYFL